jgi:hypothetical protein
LAHDGIETETARAIPSSGGCNTIRGDGAVAVTAAVTGAIPEGELSPEVGFGLRLHAVEGKAWLIY